MFLPEVKAAPLPHNPGPMPPGGEAPPEILHLFAYKPRRGAALDQFTELVMRGPSALSPWQREMIAAITSRGNRTRFCERSHAAVTGELAGDAAIPDQVLADPDSAPVSDAERALFRFAARVTADPSATRQADVDALLAAGWSEEAVFDAISVCALFKFYNTWVSAAGVADMSPAAYAASGRRLAGHGYVNPGIAAMAAAGAGA